MVKWGSNCCYHPYKVSSVVLIEISRTTVNVVCYERKILIYILDLHLRFWFWRAICTIAWPITIIFSWLSLCLLFIRNCVVLIRIKFFDFLRTISFVVKYSDFDNQLETDLISSRINLVSVLVFLNVCLLGDVFLSLTCTLYLKLLGL